MSGARAGSYMDLLARNNADRVTHFDVGSEILRIAAARGQPIPSDKILNKYTPMLDALRTAAFERLLSQVEDEEKRAGEDESEGYGAFVADIHALFPWKRSLVPTLDSFYLRQIDPDIYLTVVDNIASVALELWGRGQWNWLELDEMLSWRDQETFVTEVVSRATGILDEGGEDTAGPSEHYVISRNEPVETLARLVLEPSSKKVYLSYPISHVSKKLIERAHEFARELAKYFVVFNPMAVEDMYLVYALRDVLARRFPDASAGYSEDVKVVEVATKIQDDLRRERLSEQQVGRIIDHVSSQTVARDYKLIAQSDAVIVLYNPTQLTVKNEAGEEVRSEYAFLSAGVVCEMVYGFTNDKDVYAVWLPGGEPSPFFSYHCTNWFRNTDDLLDHLRSLGWIT